MELTYTHNELPEVARKVIEMADSKTYLFYGEMGVGKTTLITEITKQLGLQYPASSPTFSIVNEYELENESIYHFDFYRINSVEEAYDFGIEDYLSSNNILLIEWPEKIGDLITNDYNHITIKKNKNGSRTLNLTPVR
ncbi:tRNA (adenosine(37)-N6)-threonylcarbamoyltransferase complex ATPase subunit type 1 TsaE [Aequorivita echinoideorum]|uniref:tRNA threonylcarbamoyladenosine biosynthesis protein TsaE n=1 Tax=Aequorivita echinoideorum TaxID=1549647 RepID=A0ABS5S6B4_9FLAO|nr:tRNA (adenosine(37)-N6)-threonylcarbamoyltransferase complex ATPase subunit type 1 TsaE [Aequorivita echinoideorum]MBT0608749.1 tRNA (adenosine(37)-N6)-threonylcarbamoyltransferase complex ATPase subunit type 1 TsaE [Aequorivita echinoideorum]